MNMPYNDNTMLTSGPYKFTSISRIPAKWLLKIYKLDKKAAYPQKGRLGRYPDRKLIDYIEKNLESIRKRKGQPVEQITSLGHKRRGGGSIQLTCEETGKLVYVSEKDAKTELREIQKSDSEKKPVRAYECDKCSGWHLTSIPYEVWKEMKKKKRESASD